MGLSNPILDPAQVFIVIPAYNEATRVGGVLEALAPHYPNVVVVDDGSRDATFAVAARHGAHTLRHAINRGQGAALQTGITYSLGRGAGYVVTFDADGQHQVEDLPRLLAPVVSGACDIALGSRFIEASAHVPFRRRLLLRAARLFTRLTSGLTLTDAHNGLRAFSRRAAERLHLRQDRMAHASEIYDQIRDSRLAYVEVPVTIRYTQETLAKGQSGTDSLNIAWHYLFSKVAK